MTPYKAQVNPRELNLFYLESGVRERLTREGDWIVRHDSGIRYSLEDFKRLCQEKPECLSPNVLLRPLYQEIVLPNLAYIGGGGEIAYWLQLKKQFHQFEVPFPILILRNSVLHATAKQAKKAGKLGVTFADLFLSTSDLRTRVVQKIQTVYYDFTAQKNLLQEQFAALEKLAVQTDPSFLGAVKAQTHKQLKGLEHLEKRLLRAEKKKHETHLNSVEALQWELFPSRGLQERTANFSTFYLAYGPEWASRLYTELDPLYPYFSVMVWD
jgi:bacillithiol biosynthesis cysteine-adding enzyme BshC